MQNEIFPWTPKYESTDPNKADSQLATPIIQTNDKWKAILVRLKSIAPLAFIFCILLIVFILSRPNNSKPEAHSSERLTEVFTPIFPMQKGENVPLEALRVISVKRSLFSKSQQLELLNEENLKNFQGKLVAKRSLFPNQALYWKDLELKKESKQLTPKVVYSSEGN